MGCLREQVEERKSEMGGTEGACLTVEKDLVENAGNYVDLLQSPLVHWLQTH